MARQLRQLQLINAAELVQCALLPSLCCKGLAATESTCKEMKQLIVAGEFWTQWFSLSLPDFELTGDCLGILTQGDTESRAQAKKLLGTFWRTLSVSHTMIEFQGMRLPLTSFASVKQLLLKVEQALAKTRRRHNGVPGRVLLRHIRFCQEAQAPAPYRGTDAICQACEPICFEMESPSGGVQQLALQLKWVENEVRLRVMLVENGKCPFPVPEGSPSRTLSVDVLALCKVPLLATRGSQVKVGAGWYPTSGITAALLPQAELWRVLEKGLTCVIAVADFIDCPELLAQVNLSYVNCLSLQFP
ncbi:unnamed protein product [Cladocopium goreaui]|uniref:Uncharacterized protein n=1 Tax=Cladocopium goreaui TaxID=2562237 RepID=A0A9P1BFL8_9DINO|nr:unnamed protein product [Cladocopium goreaui]